MVSSKDSERALDPHITLYTSFQLQIDRVKAIGNAWSFASLLYVDVAGRFSS
jgi:hypothetical protein